MVCFSCIVSFITVKYSSVSGAFSRAFIEFVQTSSIAKELLDWSRDTYSPDEHYWATLNYNTHLRSPGGYKGKHVNFTRRMSGYEEEKIADVVLLACFFSENGRNLIEYSIASKGTCVFFLTFFSPVKIGRIVLPLIDGNKHEGRSSQPL
jgi:hypothetical protein